MLPMFQNNPEEYGTKCFPWVARKEIMESLHLSKLVEGRNGYPNVRFQITVEDLKRLGREDLIRKRNAVSSAKSGDRWARKEGVKGTSITIGLHTLVGYALFPQYFQTTRI